MGNGTSLGEGHPDELRLGAADRDKLREAQRTGVPLPSLHSSRFAPVAEPALRAGVIAMTGVVVDLMSQ